MGLDTDTIDACFSAHPLNDEEIVQEGLNQWCNGEAPNPPRASADHYHGVCRDCTMACAGSP